MDFNRIKKAFLPLLSGTALGAVASYLMISPAVLPTANPEIRVAIDSIQGMVIQPNDLNGQAERVVVRSTIDGVLAIDTISAKAKSYHSFGWSSNLQQIQLDYLDAKGKVISNASLSIGDGVIVDDLIIIGNSPSDSTESNEVQ